MLKRKPLSNHWRETQPDLLKYMWSILYSKVDRIQVSLINELALQQQQLLRKEGFTHPPASFIYKRELYHHSDNTMYLSANNLKPELQEEMEKVLTLINPLQPNERVRIHSFFVKMLNKAENNTHFMMLMPSDIKSGLLPDFHHTNIDPAYNETALSFINAHQEEFALISQRLLYNLILE